MNTFRRKDDASVNVAAHTTTRDRPQPPTGETPHLAAATSNSLRGIRDALRGTAFRQECAVGVAHYVALFLVPMRGEFRVALAMAWAAILAAELLNTAVEAVVDLASPEWHPLARKAKDAASASVFVLIALTLALWCAALLTAY